jgi:hypothetical protein
MTEPNPEARDIPLPDHVIEGEPSDEVKARIAERTSGEWPDPVEATAPKAEPDDEDAVRDDDEVDESAAQTRPAVAFPIAGPMTGSVVPPGMVNPQ